MNLPVTEAKIGCTGKGHQQFNRLTSYEFVLRWKLGE
jgi:hypothetical protein